MWLKCIVPAMCNQVMCATGNQVTSTGMYRIGGRIVIYTMLCITYQVEQLAETTKA